MLFPSIAFLFIYIIGQVMSHTKSRIDRNRKDCLAKYPFANNDDFNMVAKFDLCFLNKTRVLSSTGTLSTTILRRVLVKEYDIDSKFLDDVLDACVQLQKTLLLTAFYIKKACWFDKTKNLNQIKNTIFFWQCFVALAHSFDGKKEMSFETFKCYIGRTNVVDKDGTLNKIELSEFFKAFRIEKSVIDNVLNCAKSQFTKFDTILNIYLCIIQNKELIRAITG